MSPFVLCCISTDPDAVKEASVMREKGLDILEKASTG